MGSQAINNRGGEEGATGPSIVPSMYHYVLHKQAILTVLFIKYQQAKGSDLNWSECCGRWRMVASKAVGVSYMLNIENWNQGQESVGSMWHSQPVNMVRIAIQTTIFSKSPDAKLSMDQ